MKDRIPCIHSECMMPSLIGRDVCIFHEQRLGKKREELEQAFALYTKLGQKKIIEGYFREADFSNLTIFEKNFYLCDCTNASFYGARLRKIGFDFSLLDGVDFQEIILERVDLRRVRSAKNVFFFHAILDRVLLPSLQVLGVKNIYDYGEHYDSNKSLDVYQKLKEAYKKQGELFDSGLCFEKEMDKRREVGTRKERYWLSILWVLCGYGERPARVFASFLITILGFALIYMNLSLVSVDEGILHYDFGNALYFSVVTFTSLGYGDIRPVGMAKLFAGVEALLGIFLISLFVFVFCRKMVR